MDAELGHLLDELGIEEALLARLGLVGARLERGNGIRIGWFVVARRSAQGIAVRLRVRKAANGTTLRMGTSSCAVMPPKLCS